MYILSKNKLGGYQTLTVSSGDTSKAYLYDKDVSTCWTSVGSSDIVTESIEVVFASPITLSALCLRNHNCKQYTAQYWNGGAYVDFSTPIAETVNASSTKFHSFNSVSTLKVKFTCLKTISANAQKSIGEMLLYDVLIHVADSELPKESPSQDFNSINHKLISGGTYKVYVSSTSKYQTSLGFDILSYANYVILLALFNLKASFNYIPYDANPEYQYSVLWLNEFNFKLTSAWSSGIQAYTGSIDLGEE